MQTELHLLSQLASVAAWPAGTRLWAGLAAVEPAGTEPLVGSLVGLVIDMGQQVGAAFAGGRGAFPEECSASWPVDPWPMGLRLVF